MLAVPCMRTLDTSPTNTETSPPAALISSAAVTSIASFLAVITTLLHLVFGVESIDDNTHEEKAKKKIRFDLVNLEILWSSLLKYKKHINIDKD